MKQLIYYSEIKSTATVTLTLYLFVYILETERSFFIGMAFKTEEELKEYLENLGTEYRFSCFKEKNGEGINI